jgi:signal peptidase I
MDDTPLRRGTGHEYPSVDDGYTTTGKLHSPHPHSDFEQPGSTFSADPGTVGAHQSSGSSASMRVAVKELLETAIYILLVFMIVRSMVQNFKIEGSSMEPNLHSGEYILVNKLAYFHFDRNAPLRWLPGQGDIESAPFYLLGQPERGDIIVFEYPRNVDDHYIKRVIGMPGETVEIREGQVYINGELLDEEYLQGASTFCNAGSMCSQGPVVVPPDSLFVMGDNRRNSSDSREWDTLPMHRVIGQAWVLYYPVDDWRVIQHETYAADEQRE